MSPTIGKVEAPTMPAQHPENVFTPPPSVALEGTYTGFVIYWISYLADPSVPDRALFLWFHGLIALGVFSWICVATLRVRRQYPWRWIKALAYCICIFLALLALNTDITRFIAILAFFGYAFTVQRLYRKSKIA